MSTPPISSRFPTCRDATGNRYGRRSRSCSALLPPDEAIASVYRDDDYRLREIAGALGCHDSAVSRRLRAFGDAWCRDAKT